jgi:hypothetical protein
VHFTDVRYALRGLWLSKGFAVVAILCLGFGIGLNTTIFSIVDGVLLKSFPYANPDELRVLGTQNQKQDSYNNWVSYPDLKDWKAASTSFAGIGLVAFRTFTISDSGGEPERYPAALVSWDLFPMLGIQPIKGQMFTPDQDAVEAALSARSADRRPQDPRERGAGRDHRRDAGAL